ncbi:MAG: S-layer homology domain-containing protein [Clostridiales bacterium]|nr:S-layer homology domain-containing protein [Clostridiales bacterium]
MNKKIVSIFLVVIMLLTYIAPFSIAYTSEADVEILLNGKTTNSSRTYVIEQGDVISIEASHSSGIEKVVYAYDRDYREYTFASYGDRTVEFVPVIPAEYKDGDEHTLLVYALNSDGTYSSQWYEFEFRYETSEYDVFVPNVRLEVNGIYMNEFNVTEIEDDIIELDAYGMYDIDRTVYAFDNDSREYYINSGRGDIEIPSQYLDGDVHTLLVQFETEEDTKSIWYEYPFVYGRYYGTTNAPKLSATSNGATLNQDTTYVIANDQTITLSATHSSGIDRIIYAFDNDSKEYYINGRTGTVEIPSKYLDGNAHCLLVLVLSNDGTYSNWYSYWFKTNSDLPVVKASYNDSVMNSNTTYLIDNDEEITLKATYADGINKIIYVFDNDSTEYTINSNSGVVEIPAKYKDGEVHYLLAIAQGVDGKWSAEYVKYKFRVQAEGSEKYPLIVLDDEKVNEDINGLSIAIRTVPSATKTGNKNVFGLKEEIEYNIDFANGNKAIDGEVTIDLYIPSGYTVTFVDKNGGKLINSRQLRWTFEDGLQANEKGTIPVVLKYTAIPGSANTVKPYATIKSSSDSDSSATINYIYKNTTTVVSTSHSPYMYGDAEVNTFRPNDGLNRAEMAALLVRIFNLPKVNNTNVTYKDADVIAQGQYRWATQDIMTVTQYGLMEGYEDGTFRPGEKVTKAQLITVLARKLAVDGGDNVAANAFAIKEEPIKVFNNLSLVYSNYGYDTHWCSKYLAQMIRLNMLPDFTNTIDGNLDVVITRSQTAKLLNTVLFRGPSTDGTAGKTLTNTFVDVNSYTKDYEHILEATADSHNSKFTSNGKEIMVK